MSTPTAPSPPARSTYRHGDLRRALLEAGVELARAGGPDAVVLREATRRAGVVPNAAYRHFASRQALLQAVRAAALSAVAARDGGRAGAAAPRRRVRPTTPAPSVRAVGTGYLRFAQAETGPVPHRLRAPVDVDDAPAEAKGGQSGLNPFELLGAALDRLVAAGVLPPERRPGAEFLAWSAVHGLALLIIDGPLRGMPREQTGCAGPAAAGHGGEGAASLTVLVI